MDSSKDSVAEIHEEKVRFSFVWNETSSFKVLDLSPSIERKPLNRQEFAYYLFLATLSLFLLLIAALALWYMLPREGVRLIHVEIGNVEDYPLSDRPYAIRAEGVSLFIVRTESGWLVFDGRTPFIRPCRYVWTEANERFEDPCYGSKFTLDGTLLEGPARRYLDQYPITEKSGELFVDLTTLILGEAAEPIEG
jgi:cytochrome b6-f complex iron-sulfur subunit